MTRPAHWPSSRHGRCGGVDGERDMKLTAHQQAAIEHHCRFAFETVHPRFGWLDPRGVSVLLTVNSGYE